MKRKSVDDMTVNELVERFTSIALDQDQAIFKDQISKYNRLFKQKIEVVNALKARAGDKRNALLALFKHQNVQVRLNAAKATLAVAPLEAREMIQAIVDSKEFPQAGDAGMTIRALDDGTFRPT